MENSVSRGKVGGLLGIATAFVFSGLSFHRRSPEATRKLEDQVTYKKHTLLVSVTAITLALSTISAAALWGISLDSNLRTYGIHNASGSVEMGLTLKQAHKLAKKLNKIEKKDKKGKGEDK